MPLSLRALSSFGFSFAHSCFSLFWGAFPIVDPTLRHKFSGLVVAWVCILDFSGFWTALPIFVQTSGHRWSGLVVFWIFVSLSRTTCIPLEVFLSIEWTLWILSKNLINFDSRPHSNNRQYVFFLQHIQICISSPSHSNVLQWNRECFFFRHVELNSRVVVMTTGEAKLDRPKIGTGFSVICGFCRSRLSRFTMKFSTGTFAPYRLVPALEWVLGLCDLFLTILLYRLPAGAWIIFTPLWRQYFFRVDSSRMDFRCIQLFQFLSNFSPRSMHIRWIFLAKLSCLIDEALTGLVQKSDNIQPLHQKKLLGL